jgi:hypothetical protein
MFTRIRKPVAATTLAMLLLAACASTPIVDNARVGFDPAAYERDLADCRAIADQVRPGGRAAERALMGAVIGAAFGAVGGAFAGDAGTGAAIGASFGGMGGAAEGAGSGYERRDRVVRNCLEGRGYAILD